ncbi:MAG: class II histone deacetylase [Pseudomonadota bacterium]
MPDKDVSGSKMRKTGFLFNEACFWHSGGNYAFVQPVGDNVQPPAGSGLPENPETKRRLKNLVEMTGLMKDLNCPDGAPSSIEDLIRVHPKSYVDDFKAMSDAGGGELNDRAPFGPGGFDIARQSSGLVQAALQSVLRGELDNAYALSRPPGHHCLPDQPMGFCLLNNIAIAIEAARAAGLAERFAVIDWDVHHGNGTQAIFYDRDDVLTVSLHQENNFPIGQGLVSERGEGRGEGFNVNVPLLPGGGHDIWLAAFDRIVVPTVQAYKPDVIIVACGYDAAMFDPLSRMMCKAETFAAMTERTMELAADLCGGKLVLAHEGGYSEVYVPFCGHAVLETLSGSSVSAPDPFTARIDGQQANPRHKALQLEMIEEMAKVLVG